MNKFNKSAILSLTSLFMSVAVANADVTAAQDAQDANANNSKMEKTSDAGTVIFRIENIKPIKDQEGNVRQCSYIVTVYNRMDQQIKTADLEFMWQDNITGQYVKKIDDSANVDPDEIIEQFSSDAKELRESMQHKSHGEVMRFRPIESSIKLVNVAPHTQKSFSNIVNTDKCFLLFDNLQYRARGCELEGQEVADKKKDNNDFCSDMFNYINSKNPEYYAVFNDVPESVVQDQIEDEKNQEMERINNNYGELMKSLDKVDTALKNMR